MLINRCTKTSGFTLIEILITIVIIAILAALAAISYSSYIYKSRRLDGINYLQEISLAEERYRATNTQYATLAQLGLSSTSPNGYYTIAISSVSQSAYTITATASTAQANDKEGSTSCSSLSLSLSSGALTKSPTVCWDA